MILVRMVFQAKFGKAREVVNLFKEMARLGVAEGGSSTVMTDLSGTFDTVVQEIEVESMETYLRVSDAMFADPRVQALLASAGELIGSGSKEFYTIE